MKIRILRIIASVNPRGGGPIEGLLQQARAQAKYGIATEVASLDDPETPYVKAFPLPMHALGGGRVMPVGWKRVLPWVHYGYTPAFAPWLKAHAGEYDLVVVEGLWNYATMAARRGLAGGSTPYVVFTHGMLDPWFRKTYPLKNAAKQFLWLFNEGPLLRHAKFVLFTTEEERIVSRGAFFPYRVAERVVGFGCSDISGDAAAR